MARGRGGYSSRSYRGSSSRGSSWGGSRGSYGGRGGRFDPPFSSTFSDSRSKYSSSDRYSGSRGHGHHDDYRKPYKTESSSYSSSRDSHRHGSSPERKRPRTEASSSRHDSSYGSGGGSGGGYGSSSRYHDSSYSDRRSFSSDRHQSSSFSRKSDEFRRPSGPPPPPRGGYRGRISSRGSRISRGLKLRDRPPRRRLLESSSYAVRKRIIPSRVTDYARKIKISKMRSAIAARTKKHSSDKDGSDDEKEKPEKKTEEPKEAKEEKKEEPKKSEKEKEKESSDKEESKEEKKDSSLTSRKSFIKLNCPHCGIKAVTFRKYEMHLTSRMHLISMKKVALKQKSILAQMRMAQRNAQNELEKTSEDLVPRTNFCPLCKLNYKQRKIIHQSSDAHKNMKKFLMPYCKVCNITFKSPMIYESHCCSIEHLKRKQRVENGDESEENEEEDNNMENLTTIDSVGGDENPSEEDDKKEPVNVGVEQIRKVEAYYCDLCKMYLSRSSDEEISTTIAKHCKQRTHMQRYIRYKEDKDLEKRAEKLQRKETAEKESKVKQDKEANGLDDSLKDEHEIDDKEDDTPAKNLDDEEARDDKLWADVDKDLDAILAKESGNKSSDEDEEIGNSERYDRFKYSEKNGDEKLKKDGDEVGKNIETKAEISEVK